MSIIRAQIEVQRTTLMGDLHLKMDREPRKAASKTKKIDEDSVFGVGLKNFTLFGRGWNFQVNFHRNF